MLVKILIICTARLNAFISFNSDFLIHLLIILIKNFFLSICYVQNLMNRLIFVIIKFNQKIYSFESQNYFVILYKFLLIFLNPQ